jgi:hypothetical protein
MRALHAAVLRWPTSISLGNSADRFLMDVGSSAIEVVYHRSATARPIYRLQCRASTGSWRVPSWSLGCGTGDISLSGGGNSGHAKDQGSGLHLRTLAFGREKKQDSGRRRPIRWPDGDRAEAETMTRLRRVCPGRGIGFSEPRHHLSVSGNLVSRLLCRYHARRKHLHPVNGTPVLPWRTAARPEGRLGVAPCPANTRPV